MERIRRHHLAVQRDHSKEPALDGDVGAFGRAYVAFKIAEEFGRQRQIGKYTKPVMMMRVLAAVMQENGVAEPADITPAPLDAAVDRIRAQGGDSYGVEQRAKTLEWVAQALNAGGVVRSPFEWSIGRARFNMESRLSASHDRCQPLVSKHLLPAVPDGCVMKMRRAGDGTETTVARGEKVMLVSGGDCYFESLGLRITAPKFWKTNGSIGLYSREGLEEECASTLPYEYDPEEITG